MSITITKPFLILNVKVGTPSEIGLTGAGARRFIPIIGGQVCGSIQGEVIPGGADWQTIHDNGNLQIEAHYAVRAQNGSVIEVLSSGVRAGAPEVLKRLAAGDMVDPGEYYFRTAIRFRTGAPELTHLNFRLGIAKGERRRDSVRLEVFEVV